MGNVDDFDHCVSDFMDDFGGIVTLIIASSSGQYDPTTGDFSTTVTNYDVQAILLDLTLRNNGLTDVPNTLIQTGDKRCFIRPLNKTDPTKTMPVINPASDRLSMGGLTYKIITMKQINTAMVNAVLFELILRQ